jgi:hypothetical protein
MNMAKTALCEGAATASTETLDKRIFEFDDRRLLSRSSKPPRASSSAELQHGGYTRFFLKQLTLHERLVRRQAVDSEQVVES